MNGSGERRRSSERKNKNKNDKMSTAVSSHVVITSFKKLVIEYKPTGKPQGRKRGGAKFRRNYIKAEYASNCSNN